MNIVFGDLDTRANLLPLTYTRPTSHLRCGIVSLGEKWMNYLQGRLSHATAPFLSEQFPISLADDNLLVNPLVLPTEELITEIHYLDTGSSLHKGHHWIAARISHDTLIHYTLSGNLATEQIAYKGDVEVIEYPWHLFQQNSAQILSDFARITRGRKSALAHESATLIGDNIFIEEGAQVVNCSLNSMDGPIYIGKNSKILDGAFIRGPFALCEGATVNMGAKIKDGTTIGPHSKVGGEVGNSILIGYSNKGHDGYLGNSVIGEWCNLGADTNTSNLKNNYSNIRVWNYPLQKAIDTQTQFCGLIMGDHSKCGINTMFNTGTVVGVSANIFGGDFPPKYIPSFAWGGSAGFDTYKFDKAIEVAERVMARRNKTLGKTETAVLQHIFNEKN